MAIRYNHPNGDLPEDKGAQETHLECSPNDEFPYIISIDNRLTLADLKERMCETLKLDPFEVIMRRGGRAGLELKDLKSEIDLSHFVRGTSIYLEKGCPLN